MKTRNIIILMLLLTIVVVSYPQFSNYVTDNTNTTDQPYWFSDLFIVVFTLLFIFGIPTILIIILDKQKCVYITKGMPKHSVRYNTGRCSDDMYVEEWY